MAQQALEHLVVLFEHQILQPRAELRIHEPFADPGAEDLQDAFADMLVLPRGGGRNLGAAGYRLKPERIPQPLAEEIVAHQVRSSQSMPH